MKTIIVICGIFNLSFGIFHLGFWKLFKWDRELKKLSFENKGIMQILNIQMVYFFLFTALICFVFSTELLTNQIGKMFLLGCSLFWLLRTIQQFIFFNLNSYKIHILTVLFIIGTILFAVPLFSQLT